MGAVLVVLASGCREDSAAPPPAVEQPPPIEEKPDAGHVHDAGVIPSDGGTDAGVVDAGNPTGEDAGVTDAGVDAGIPNPTDAGVPLPGSSVIYSPDRIQSPIDSSLVQRLKAIAARGTGRERVFARVGDSVSIAFDETPSGSGFLNCFDGILEGQVSWDVNIRLGAYSQFSPAIDYFKTPLSPTTTCYSRISKATKIGMTASWPTTGNPSPVDQELDAINPRFAVVLYGSNDVGYGGQDEYPVADQVERYEKYMRKLIDHLLDRGVIPIVNTMPPDGDFLWVTPAFSAAMRAIAQGRQVPMIDFWQKLYAMGYPYGLRSDHTHPSQQDYNTCCWFDPNSLATYGENVRNLITIEAFDRMRRIFSEGATELDPNAPHVVGDGSVATPFVIDRVPWGELRDINSSSFTPTEALSCAGAPPVPGKQFLYKLVLTQAKAVRILLLDGGQHGQQLSLLLGTTLNTCVKTDPRLISTTLPAGTYYIAVNGLSATGGTEFNLSVSECMEGDYRCSN